jgi:hypothetical protein
LHGAGFFKSFQTGVSQSDFRLPFWIVNSPGLHWLLKIAAGCIRKANEKQILSLGSSHDYFRVLFKANITLYLNKFKWIKFQLKSKFLYTLIE